MFSCSWKKCDKSETEFDYLFEEAYKTQYFLTIIMPSLISYFILMHLLYVFCLTLNLAITNNRSAFFTFQVFWQKFKHLSTGTLAILIQKGFDYILLKTDINSFVSNTETVLSDFWKTRYRFPKFQFQNWWCNFLS